MQTSRGGHNILSTHTLGRVGAFIDESNLFHSQKTLKWRVDYEKLYWMLRDLDLGTRNIFLYTSFLKTSQKQLEFIDKLVDYGYFVHSKPVKEIKSGSNVLSRKGNLDIELALDAFQFSHLYDTLILFSGDSDFDYLLELLKQNGKKTIVVSARKNISFELMRRSHVYLDLKKLRYYIEDRAHKSLKATLADGFGGTTVTIISK